MSVRGLLLITNMKSNTGIHPFFLFYQSTALSSHAVDDHQMYLGGSVKLEQLIYTSRQPSRSFYRGVKMCEMWRLFQHHSTLELLAFENVAIYPNVETNYLCRNDRPMSSASLLKLGPRTPEKLLSVLPHP